MTGVSLVLVMMTSHLSLVILSELLIANKRRTDCDVQSEVKSCERALRRVDHGEVSGFLDQLNYQLQG